MNFFCLSLFSLHHLTQTHTLCLSSSPVHPLSLSVSFSLLIVFGLPPPFIKSSSSRLSFSKLSLFLSHHFFYISQCMGFSSKSVNDWSSPNMAVVKCAVLQKLKPFSDVFLPVRVYLRQMRQRTTHSNTVPTPDFTPPPSSTISRILLSTPYWLHHHCHPSSFSVSARPFSLEIMVSKIAVLVQKKWVPPLQNRSEGMVFCWLG